MCQNSTLSDISRQQADIDRINQRFLDPIDILQRYKTFHCNCEALIDPSDPTYQIHHKRAKEFREVLQILEEDLDNG